MFTKFPNDQEVFFKDGSRRIVERVVRAEQGTWWHLMDEKDTEYIMNPSNINFVRVTKSNEDIHPEHK